MLNRKLCFTVSYLMKKINKIVKTSSEDRFPTIVLLQVRKSNLDKRFGKITFIAVIYCLLHLLYTP